MTRWNGYRDGEQIIGGMDYEVAKNVVLDSLAFEAGQALANQDATNQKAAEDAWANLDEMDNQEFRADVNGVSFRLEKLLNKAIPVSWCGYRDGEQIIGGVDFEVAKNALLDNLSFEADRALDHHDLATREAADDAWAILDGLYNQELHEDVNGVEYRLERSSQSG